MITAYKNSNVVEPIESIVRNQSPQNTDKILSAFREITDIETIKTKNGNMMSCKIHNIADINAPSENIICCIGSVKPSQNHRGTVNLSLSYKLWFYDGKYWLNARDKNGVEYIKNGKKLLYEVSVTDDVVKRGLMDESNDTDQS